MGYRRVDATTIEDELGNRMWMPDPALASGPTQALMAPDFSTPPPPDNGTDLRQGPGLQPPQRSADEIMAAITAASGARPDLVPMGAAPGAPEAPPPPTPPLPPPPPAPPPPTPPPIPQLPSPPRTVAGAEADQAGAVSDVAAAGAATTRANYDAEVAHQTAALAADGESTRDLDALQAHKEATYQAWSKKADADNNKWLQDQKELAKTPVDRHHAWNSSDGFSKAMWMVSILASAGAGVAAAQSKAPDQSKTAMKMLQDYIQEDIGAQRATLDKELAIGREKGESLRAAQSRDLGHLNDQYAGAFQRWSTIRDAAAARAKGPIPQDLAAGYARVVEAATQNIQAIATQRVDATRQDYQAGANRAVQYHGQALADARERDRLAQSAREGELDRQNRKDLAQMEIEGRTASAAAGREAKTYEMSRDSGFSVRNPDGSASRFAVPKELAKEAGEVGAGYAQAQNAMARVVKALGDSNETSYLIGSDGRLNSAFIEAGRPLGRALNGGGKTTEADEAAGMKAMFGIDPESLVSKAKGWSREQQQAFVEERMSRLPKEAQVDMSARFGFDLPEGSHLEYVAPSTQNVDKSEMSDSDLAAAAGAKLTAPKAPTSGWGYLAAKGREADNPGGGLPSLDREGQLGGILRDAAEVAERNPQHVTDYVAKSTAAINAWEKSHRGAGAAAQAKDARFRLEQDVAAAAARGQDRVTETVDDLLSRLDVAVGFGTVAPSVEDIKTAATRNHLALDPGALNDLVDRVNAELKRRREAGPYAR